jgi:hypothetical protein
MLNKDVFVVDPTGRTLPNDGVTSLDPPRTDAEWAVLKYELEQFVAEGEYREGLRRVLSSCLGNLDKQTQPACWVSGFYGSGKSHFLRVLASLWTNPIIDGVAARALVKLPDEVKDLLTELDAYAKRDRTVPFAAAGVLRRGQGSSLAQPLLEIILSAADLPTQYGPAKFALWLHEEGVWGPFVEALESHGKSEEEVSRNLFVSPAIRKALLDVIPGFATSEAEAGTMIRANYQVRDLSDDMVIDSIRQVLDHVGRSSRYAEQATTPLTLLVIDEMQQYIGEDVQLLLAMQDLIERLTKQFQGRLLVVAAGQSALTANELLARFQDRFTVEVQLQSKDVKTVVRQVVLRKDPVQAPALDDALTAVSGEIARHLGGSKLAARPSDNEDLVPDYPLLPTRRRFVESSLRAVDRGAAGQLRSQLRVTMEAVSDVAGAPLGTVIPGDVVFSSKKMDMLNQGVLLHDLADRIAAVRDGSPAGETRARAVELIFLISQLDQSEGVRPTVDTLADLMVTDLNAGSATLRAELPGLLAPLVGNLLILDDNEYRLQSPTDAEWTQAFKNHRQGYLINISEQVHAREDAIRRRLEQDLSVVKIVQGETATPRKYAIHQGEAVPEQNPTDLVVWVRNGWEASESQVRATVADQGQDSSMVTIFLPKLREDELRNAIADWRAAATVTQTMPPPTTEEGLRARDAMASTAKRAEERMNGYAAEVVAAAQVLLGGGEAISSGGLAGSVKEALGKAAVRKFPKFKDADHSGWPMVFKRAREGNQAAMEAVGHKQDAASHPVTSQVLTFLGQATQTGSAIHKHFHAEPFGWPKDAINGALAALIVSEDVQASQGAQPVPATSLTDPAMTKLNFAAVSRKLTFDQRMSLRQLATKLGVQSNPPDVPACLTALKDAASAAGGPAPLPLPPPPTDLETLLGMFGVEQQIAVADQAPQLTTQWEDWKSVAKKAAERMPHWEEAQQLLRHARDLPNHDAHQAGLEAIREQRSLLTDPNPLPPMLDALRADLRAAIRAAHDQAAQAQKEAVGDVVALPQWPQLPEAERSAFLAENGLVAPEAPDVVDDTRLLEALEKRPLSARWEQGAAFAGKAVGAGEALVKKVTPEAKPVRPSPALLTNPAEVDAYVAELRTRILDVLAAGHPVSIK